MKSKTFELHNYAATLTPDIGNMSEQKAAASHRHSEKYSLRQRQKRRNTRSIPEDHAHSSTGFSSDHSSGAEMHEVIVPSASVKSSVKKNNNNSSKSGSKSKSKPAPLSKYRRKTANARERTRMREINTAFENLRHCVPLAITGDDTNVGNEKLTKITTLRLAMRYIGLLSEALDSSSSYDNDFLLECLRDVDERRNTQPARILSEDYQMESTEEKMTHTQKTKSSKNTSKSSQKRNGNTKSAKRRPNSKQQQQSKLSREATVVAALNSPESAYCSSTLTSPTHPTPTASPHSTCISLSANSTLDNSSTSSKMSDLEHATAFVNIDALTELHTLLLESDGESLNLSEHCLSPNSYSNMLNSTAVTSLPTSSIPYQGDLPDLPAAMEQTDVELNLRLLDPSAEIDFDFDSDQQPSTCISPLATLDSFNPFSDLLHTDFPETSTLDLYLT